MNTNDAFSLTNGWGKTNMHLAPTGSSLTNEPAGHLSLTNEVLIDAAQFRAKWGTSNVTVTLALRVSGNDMAEVKQLNFTLSQPLVSEAEWAKRQEPKIGAAEGLLLVLGIVLGIAIFSGISVWLSNRAVKKSTWD